MPQRERIPFLRHDNIGVALLILDYDCIDPNINAFTKVTKKGIAFLVSYCMSQVSPFFSRSVGRRQNFVASSFKKLALVRY